MTKYIIVLFLLSISLQANWEKKQVTCPVCLEKNEFLKIKTFSNDIYMRPSRLEYVFFPHTDSRFFYCCRNCSFTTFSWHFQELPMSKLAAISDNLYKVVSEAVKKYDFDNGAYLTYDKVPMAMKLHIAEKVYKLWGFEKDDFWCEFYRIKGYHFEQESRLMRTRMKKLEKEQPAVLTKRKHPGKIKSILSAILYPVLKFIISDQTKDFIQHYRYEKMKNDYDHLVLVAKESRQKSLEIAEKVLKNKNLLFSRKEYLYVAGAMSHLIKDKIKAKKYFEEALKIDYKSKQMNETENKQYSIYLNKLIQEYLRTP